MHPGTPRVDELLAAMEEPSMVAGHDHKQWFYSRGGKRAFAAGSVGLAHTGRPCQAEYLLLRRQGGGFPPGAWTMPGETFTGTWTFLRHSIKRYSS